MSQPSAAPRPPGRGMVIAGSILLGVGLLGVGVTFAVFGDDVDLDAFQRDVAVSGPSEASVPGPISFRVIERLSSDEDDMDVAVALPAGSPRLECTIEDGDGEVLAVRSGTPNDTILNPEVDSFEVLLVAEDLLPGDYRARCTGSGEPSDSTFAVARVLTPNELFDDAGALLGIAAGVMVGGLTALVGFILLMIGLVVGRRFRRNSNQPPPSQPPSHAPPPTPPPYRGPPPP